MKCIAQKLFRSTFSSLHNPYQKVEIHLHDWFTSFALKERIRVSILSSFSFMIIWSMDNDNSRPKKDEKKKNKTSTLNRDEGSCSWTHQYRTLRNHYWKINCPHNKDDFSCQSSTIALYCFGSLSVYMTSICQRPKTNRTEFEPKNVGSFRSLFCTCVYKKDKDIITTKYIRTFISYHQNQK